MSFYQQLIEQTHTERAYLLSAPLIQRCLQQQGFTLGEYQAFLTEAYHHVKHTVPLLMAVGSRLSSEQEFYREAIAEYIEEELGHQEWVLNDIAATGADKELVRHGQPNLATELMVSYAYDSIQRGNPLAFFGMVLVLEGTSVNLATGAADIIQHQLQLPKKAFSYLRSHGSLDIEHLGFFEKLMNTIANPADQRAIVHAAKVFYQLYGNIFRSIEAAPAAKAAA
jgi:pyrroloquinoline quinone (PQQ) biosynthesis protein C